MWKVGNMGNPRLHITLELLPNEGHVNPMLTTKIEKLSPNECLGFTYSAATYKLSPIEGPENCKRGNYLLTISYTFTGTANTIICSCRALCPGDVHGGTTFQVGPSEGDVPLQPPPQGPVIPYYDIDGAIADVGESERIVATSKAWDNWFHNIMNPNEFRDGGRNRSIRCYMGLTHYNPYDRPHRSSAAPQLRLPGSSIGGSSSVAAQLGLPGSSIGGSSIVVAADHLGFPGPSTGGNSSVVAASLGLPGPSLGRSSRVVPN
ncbi:hypothetical protein V6N13_073839 [Hibiscus sabdariffa]